MHMVILLNRLHACKLLSQLAVILKIWQCFFGCAIKEIEFRFDRCFVSLFIALIYECLRFRKPR